MSMVVEHSIRKFVIPFNRSDIPVMIQECLPPASYTHVGKTFVLDVFKAARKAL